MSSAYERHLEAVGATEIAITSLASHIHVAHEFARQTMDMARGAVGDDPRNPDAQTMIAILAEVEEMLGRQIEAADVAIARLVLYANTL